MLTRINSSSGAAGTAGDGDDMPDLSGLSGQPQGSWITDQRNSYVAHGNTDDQVQKFSLSPLT